MDELNRIIKTLRAWGSGQKPPLVRYGICGNLPLSYAAVDDLLSEAFRSWPNYSGDPRYPVPDPKAPSDKAAANRIYENRGDLWDYSPYGNLRRELCLYVADWLEANKSKVLPLLRRNFMTDYIRQKLLRAIELLESWAGDQLPPPDKLSGICVNLALVQKLPRADWNALVAEAAKTWPEWSGDPLYPVAHTNLLPETAYTALGEVPKWAGEYGAARRRLCQHVADWIRAHPREASRTLWGR